MQLAIPAQGIFESAFCFRKRRWIENDQIVFSFGFLGAAQKRKDVLLNPAHFESVSFRILFSSGDVVRILFDCGNVCRAGLSTRERERALIGETIEDAALGSERGD